jgi:hypothetical protein
MDTLAIEAIRWLQNTERFYYDGTDRHEMKLALKRYVETNEKDLLECCPFYVGLVYVNALRLLDESPDYF